MSRALPNKLDYLPELDKVRSWQPENWGPRHRIVCQMIAAGFRNKEIAEALGYTEARVSQIRCDPRAHLDVTEFQQRMGDNIIDLNVRLKAHAVEALDEIVDELRNAEDPRIRQKAAFGILDRAGYTPINKSVVLGAQIDARVAERMERTLNEFDAVDEFEYEQLPPGQDVSEAGGVEESGEGLEDEQGGDP